MKGTCTQLWRITLDTNPEDCNLHCIMCEEHSRYSNFKNLLFERTGTKRRVMPIEWLEPIMRQAKELGVKEIIPSTMGEPLLYNGFEKIVGLCREYEMKLNLTTNGTFVRKSVEQWGELLIPLISDVKFSWNGARSETAEKIMQGINFDRTLQKLKQFIRMRDHHYHKTGYYCRISFQLTFMQENVHELADMIKLAAALGVDRVKGHHLWKHFNELDEQSMLSSPQSIKQWNECVKKVYSMQEQYRKPDGTQVILENIYNLQVDESKEVPAGYECPFLNRELWISATGTISPCCAPDELRQSLGNFGNIQQIRLNDVLRSEQYQNLLQHYPDMEVCKKCNMRRPRQ